MSDESMPHYYGGKLSADESERVVLASVLNDGREALELALDQGLVPEDFGDRFHGAVFEAAIALSDSNEIIDPPGVAQWLKANDLLDEVGLDEVTVIADLFDVRGETYRERFAIPHHADVILERATARKCHWAAGEIQLQARDGVTADDLMKSWQAYGDAIREGLDLQDDTKTVYEHLRDIQTELTNPEAKLPTYSTGFKLLDMRMGGGYHQGDLTIIAARPSMGKTAWAFTSMMSLVDRGHKVGFFSLEMPARKIVDRGVAFVGGVMPDRVRSREDASTVAHSTAALTEMLKDDDGNELLLIDDKPGQTVEEIKRRAKEWVKQGVEVIFIDYLQLMRPTNARDPEHIQIAHQSKSLKILARELSIPVICLSQLSRAVESRTDKRPMMSDIRGSGSVEQDADQIGFLYREEYYKGEDCPPELMGKGELILSKNRNGPTGPILLDWDAQTMSYSSPSAPSSF